MIRINIFILCCFLCSCGKFSQSNLLSRSFGIDLRPFITLKQTSYSDGCLQIFDVSENDTIYKKFLSDNYLDEPVALGFEEITFSTSQFGEIRYRQFGEFDGFIKLVFYIPKSKILGFGYCTAMGG